MKNNIVNKLNYHGMPSLSNIELLSLLLTQQQGTTDIRSITTKLMSQYPTLTKLYTTACSPNSQQTYWPFLHLHVSHTLCQRLYHEKIEQKTITGSLKALNNFLLSQFCAIKHESFACLFLDSQHQLISFEHLFRGTVNKTMIYPREIARRALELNSTAIIAAHNHPSGHVQPSQADLRITKTITQAIDLFDIKLIDHYIIGIGNTLSMLHEGLLPDVRTNPNDWK